MKNYFILALLVFAANASAKCFKLEVPVSEVGPLALVAPADKICIYKVNRMMGGQSFKITLSDREGDLAVLGSKTEATGRCLEECKLYVLEGGNANGQNVAFNPPVSLTLFNGALEAYVQIGSGRYPISSL